MSAVLDYILRTNLFNFIIFAGIIGFLCVKLDVLGSLDKAKDTVKDSVTASETAKKVSEKKLADIEAKVSNLENEVEDIIKKSVDNASLVGNGIISDANKTVDNIKDNSGKLVENRTAILKNDILRRASLASVEVAKNYIINELNNNYDLHNKLIDESVEAINGIGGGNG